MNSLASRRPNHLLTSQGDPRAAVRTYSCGRTATRHDGVGRRCRRAGRRRRPPGMRVPIPSHRHRGIPCRACPRRIHCPGRNSSRDLRSNPRRRSRRHVFPAQARRSSKTVDGSPSVPECPSNHLRIRRPASPRTDNRLASTRHIPTSTRRPTTQRSNASFCSPLRSRPVFPARHSHGQANRGCRSASVQPRCCLPRDGGRFASRPQSGTTRPRKSGSQTGSITVLLPLTPAKRRLRTRR